MKKIIVLSCALYLVLSFGTVFAASPNKVTTTLNDIPPAWSKTLQCDATACPRFELVMGGAAVLDHETGLVWEQAPSIDRYSWINDNLICARKTVGGRLGWHLPTAEQLLSLVDPTAGEFEVTLPIGHPFSNIGLDKFWSATLMALAEPANPSAYSVNFFRGYLDFESTDFGYRAWCVRGGQSNNGSFLQPLP
jgi:hypothetical protein